MNRHLLNIRHNSPFVRLKAPFASRYDLQPADRVVEPIFQTGITRHHAIYLGVDANGTEWIAENQRFHGVTLVSADAYFQKEKQIWVEPFAGSYKQREVAVKRALEALGKPYDLVSYNCEHYASYVQTGTAESKQVNNVMDGVKSFAIAALLLSFFTYIVND